MLAFGVLVLAAALVVPGVRWLLKRRARRRFAEKLMALGARGKGLSLALRCAGHWIWTDFKEHGRHEPGHFGLFAPGAAPGGFHVVARNAADGMAENLGLEGRIQTGDPEFDGRFRAEGDRARGAASFLAAPAKRSAVESLFALGCARVEVYDTGVGAVWTPFKPDADTDVLFVRDALPHLAALVDSPRPAPPEEDSGLTQRSFERAVVPALKVLPFAVAGLQLLLSNGGAPTSALDEGDLIRAALRLAVPVLGLYLAALGLLLRGKSWFVRGFAQGAFLGLIAFPLAGFLAAAWINPRYDSGAPTSRRAPVVRKWRGTGSKLFLAVASWRPGRATEDVAVSRREFDAARPGSTTVFVETKPGALGVEWVTRRDVASP